MDHTVNVLDHGLVRLVSYMQPAVQAVEITKADYTELDAAVEQGRPIPEKMLADYSDWTGDYEVVRNARVSYDGAARAGEDEGSDSRLINYLMKNRHTTPFEAMSFTFEIKAPIFVLRQWHRHRTWSYNELSARYRELPEEFYVPEEDKIGTQSTDNKQVRDMPAGLQDDLTKLRASALTAAMEMQNVTAFECYRKLLEQGVPRELARTVLPLATYSHMFASVDLHNLLHFCELRMHSHAQYEIRVYAEAMLKLVEPICPAVVKAFRKHVLPQQEGKPATVDTTPRVVVGHMTEGKLHKF